MPAIPEALRERLRRARRVLFLTGSGASAESGVPTFRDDPEGLWARYRPEELATPDAFDRDPALVWRWYQWRRNLIRKAAPNAGHYAIADFQTLLPGAALVTQNVDGLHQRAGSPEPVEYHGNLFRDRCTAACGVIPEVSPGPLPACPGCGALARPDVIWFGESIEAHNLEVAARLAEECELFFSIGTSSLVWPAAGLAETAAANKAVVVEVNPSSTAQSPMADFRLAGLSGEILPALLSAAPQAGPADS